MELWAMLKELLFVVGFLSPGGSFPEPLPPKEEQKALRALAEGDEEAKRLLIRHNLRLVAHVAKKFPNVGMETDDLVSIGTIGLIKAVSSFDPRKGATLATYAARCIQNEILMSLRSSKKRQNDVSLFAAIGTDHEGNEITLADVMGTSPDAVTDEVERRTSAQCLRTLVDSILTQRERVVVVLRYGLSGQGCLAQREVAKLLGISRSYVSRIEKKALEKLGAALEGGGEKAE